MKILVVGRDNHSLVSILAERDHQVTHIQSGKVAWENLVKHHAEYESIFLQEDLLDLQVMDFIHQSRNYRDHTPIVCLASYDKFHQALEAIPMGATEVMLTPIIPQVLEITIHKLENVLLAKKLQEDLSFLKETTQIEIGSDISYVSSVCSHLLNKLKPMSKLYNMDENALGITIQESVANAVIHGNLEVPSSLKEESWFAFDDLVKERQTQQPYKARKVWIRYEITKEFFTLIVEDEGKGFNPSSIPQIANPDSWQKLSGRGLLMIRTFMEKVSWNDIGNVITMTKKLHRSEK